jgi:hypothetical protein
MVTPRDDTQKTQQFRRPGQLVDETEAASETKQQSHLPVKGRQSLLPLPPPATGQRNILQKQPPAIEGQSVSQFKVPITGRLNLPATLPSTSGQYHTSQSQAPESSVLRLSQFKLPATERQSISEIQPSVTGKQGVSRFPLPITGRQGVPEVLSPITGEQGVSRFPLPITGGQGVPEALPLISEVQSIVQFQPPVMGKQGIAGALSSVNNGYSIPLPQKRRIPRVKPRTALILAVCNITLIALIVSAVLLVQHRGFLAQIHQADTQTAPSTPALNTITNNKEISPLIFGTNMALFQDNDEPIINSAQTRQLLKDIGVRLIRMPTRSTLSDATEIAGARAIKEIGAVPLIVINGPGFAGGSILQSDEHILDLMSQVFGSQPVYYEFGNEADLQGITADEYVQVWNQVVPQLKQKFPTARFIGPDNYEFTRAYLKTFVQKAQPRPDGVSWHEYACSIHWTADFCLANIDAWTVHVTQARLAMQEAIGMALPIWISEWNYASDTSSQTMNDGKANNPTFMRTWTEKAMQALVANRVFAAMQYFATAKPMPLVLNNQIGIEGTIFQQEYKKVMVDGYTPPVATITYPTPTATVNPHEMFSFEDGSTAGWTSTGAGITQPVNSTAEAFDGTHSLRITLSNPNETDMPYVSVPVSHLATPPKAGQMITAYLYVDNKAAIMNAKIFVANAQYAWLFANSLTLTSGHWNRLWFALPVDFSSQAMQVGIQFFTSTPGVSTDVYIDAVNWQ